MTEASTTTQRAERQRRRIPEEEAIAQADALFTRHYERIHDLAAGQHRRCYGHVKEEAIAETEAFVLRAFRDLALRGADPEPLLSAIIAYQAGHVRAGRRFAGKVHAHDALSAEAGAKAGRFVTHLPHADKEQVAGEVRDAMRDRSPSPAAEAIARLDYEAWLDTLTDRERSLAAALLGGNNMTDVARERGISKAAVQDMRSRMARKWARRQGYEDGAER